MVRQAEATKVLAVSRGPAQKENEKNPAPLHGEILSGDAAPSTGKLPHGRAILTSPHLGLIV
jgi:hypothetical protein